ncbi:hypothetical protein R9C00_25390 [Flammeovirgaceae bacterium SG7u.111]|nr:hypothetical protein [Flammeovirgaceae bacterium SG7u.132]WPO35031.1 hypothetical protein R9C00_25390 [Flammeovirgaceae bacterium SG7u.111]
MITVNKKLMSQVQFFLLNNNRIKAIDLLCAHKCDLDLASEIVSKLATNEAYIDQYIIDRIKRLLPQQKIAATKTLSIYYEVRLSYAKHLIDSILKNDITEENIRKVLDKLNPKKRSGMTSEHAQKPSGFYQSKLLQLMANGYDEQGVELIMDVLEMDEEEASGYMEDFRSNLTRTEF